MSTTIEATTIELAGRQVHRVGYGAMQLATGSSAPSHHDAVALLRAAGDLGVDHLDTAEFYGSGRLNRAIGQAFPSPASSPQIATKIGAREIEAAMPHLIPAQHPGELRDDVEANLRSLGRETLDLVYLRRLDFAPGIVAPEDQQFPLADQLEVLTAMRDEGLITAIGLSHVSVAQLREALPAGIAAVQDLHNLINREFESVLDLARAHQVAWIPYLPLGSAFAGWHRVTEQPEVIAAATELGRTPAQVGLAWLLAQYDRTVLIPGSLNLEHIRENLAATALDHAAVAALLTVGPEGLEPPTSAV